MPEMNEKEAREILKFPANKSAEVELSLRPKAEGFMDRLSQEKRIFGPLVEVLEKMKDGTIHDTLHPANCLAGDCICVSLKAEGILETFYKECPEWKK